jgi:hypothetical protein
MPIVYECHPVPDLHVIPISNIITRACLAPCFLDGVSQYHTIPRRFHSLQKRHFDGGAVDTAIPSGNGSKLYELNLYAMKFGRPKERIMSVSDELAKRKARKAVELARAAAQRRETYAQRAQAKRGPGA